MEIGSIYEINPDSYSDKVMESSGELTLDEIEKYGKKQIRFTSSGREAIALALRSLEKNRPDIVKRCLLPVYMCDTVFFPFERAGWEIHFYHIDKNLVADANELSAQIAQIKPGLIFIHPYYGIDTWKAMRPLLGEWRKQGICIMEDVTQSYYLDGVGKDADYVVGSLRKWYFVPDGGFVAADEFMSDEKLYPNVEFTEKRLELMTEKWEYLHGCGNVENRRRLKDDFLKKNRQMEQWLDDYEGISSLSDEAACILAAENEKSCSKRRNENYRYLRGRLAGKKYFVHVFDNDVTESGLKEEDAQDAAPLYFPIYASDREALQGFLTAHDIYAPILWPVGKENEAALTQDERYIYDHLLALPIDQRYGITEMQRIADVLEQYEKKVSDGLKKIVGIRVDANDTVAMGHVMRCITIAGQLVRKGCRVLFFTADEYAREMIEQAGMEYVCLHTQWEHMEEEIPVLREELQKAGCKKLLVDSYQVTAKYFERLRDICRLIYIDDCFDTVYPVDMIVNYNAYHVRFPYEETYAGRAKLLLGTAYVPLREEFCRIPGNNDEPKVMESEAYGNIHVLLSSGGGDICDALSGILSKTVGEEALDDIIFHVIVGNFNRNVKKLENLEQRYPNILLHYRVNNMAELMQQCMAAVSAAGTMLFELSAMQIPTVFFVSADNQRYDSEFFAQNERMLFAGDIRKDRDSCLENIYSQLKMILRDEEMQDRMKRRLHEVTDGKGAMRIADEIFYL